ncbi:hypothetical protein VTK73DRAFT_1183 [Phialemonium thermophilum]|uniref:Elongator complex protein 4 n=1 Tax=Phialemonium thermophilum TaxID=223376 RepID=A0ABR3VTU7_9PEZI
MSFRKRNTVISTAQQPTSPAQEAAGGSKTAVAQLPSGVRPSPLDGRPTTSTGTSSLDHLLAGHVGLPLGTSLLVEEQGTTDFSGVLLRYYAAEGLVQGHHVHVLGFGDSWAYGLPALAASKDKAEPAQATRPPEDRMKIAWRYEALANNDGSSLSRRADDRQAASSTFCHSFDLSKRLASSSIKGSLRAMPSMSPTSMSLEASATPSPFGRFLSSLEADLVGSAASVVHRVAIPSLLAPTLYASSCCRPKELLQFLHGLRALLRRFRTRLTAMISLPISLFPRSSGLTRWMELVCDGVIELVPLPPDSPAFASPARSAKTDPKAADQSQGLLIVHSLPVYHEKGGGGAESNHFRENLVFSLSASKGLVIKPFSLPPLGGEDSDKGKSPASTVKDGLDF